MKYINSNLVTLKCVLFLFFGGLGCLIPFLPLHMVATGLTIDELRIISIVAPCIAIIGPAVAGPLADRLAGGFGGTARSKTGKYLRVMIAICLLLAAIFYWLLMTVPRISRSPPVVEEYMYDPFGEGIVQERRCLDEHTCDKWKSDKVPQPPSSYFVCDHNGANIIQEKSCKNDMSCYNWDANKMYSVYLVDCLYACKGNYNFTRTIDFRMGDDMLVEPVDPIHFRDEYLERTGLPHICHFDGINSTTCEAFSIYSQPVPFKVKLSSADSSEDNNNSTEGVCRYAIDRSLSCRITDEARKTLEEDNSGLPDEQCEPVVHCGIHQRYNMSAMKVVLVEPDCAHSNVALSFWLYLIIRSIADIFPAAAVALLDAAIIIATRETSTGRGDVGKQFAAGALGFAIFAPICGAISDPLVALILFSVLMVLAALIMLFDGNMPLSPAEWWWHTRCGLLALPMSSIRKYTMEISALAIVLVLLGVFWNGIDPYLPWYVIRLEGGTPLLIGLTITVGALPAVVYLIFAEKIVDYCGHSNLLIQAFTLYIIHYTGLSFIDNPWWFLVCEALEIFTLHLMWVTVVLYLRHLVPRRFIASGQALAVIAHFCLGRFLGALIGGIAYTGSRATFSHVQSGFAVAAAIIAILYFLIYHFYLKPRCAAPVTDPPRPEPALIQSTNGNGSYTPLRVYHNGKAKKGQFRY